MAVPRSVGFLKKIDEKYFDEWKNFRQVCQYFLQ